MKVLPFDNYLYVSDLKERKSVLVIFGLFLLNCVTLFTPPLIHACVGRWVEDEFSVFTECEPF